MTRSEADLLSIISNCERRLSKLEVDLKKAPARKNKVIYHNVECARQTAYLSLDAFASGQFQQSETYADIALLRTNFACKAFQTEQVESMLGESDYLEFSEDWLFMANAALNELELVLKSAATALSD